MVWCMVRQALYPDPSCRATLAWLQAARENVGLPFLSRDTSGYCKARQRLPFELLPRLARRVAQALNNRVKPEQLWFGRRVLAADGSAFSMPDTVCNQARFHQSSLQKEGCGFPVGGFVAVICLATGAIVDAFVGDGKMHDLTMFKFVRSCFLAGDIFLADRGFSAYTEMAFFLGIEVDSVVRLHQRRVTDFRRGHIIGDGDHIVKWLRPESCPKGLSPVDFKQLPPFLLVREIEYQVTANGFRTRKVILATTLLDAKKYPAQALANLYSQRWEIEVDFRHLKITMQMDVMRGHSPDVVEKEFWAHILAYNLLRSLMWDAGERYGESALKLSLKGAIQHLFPYWSPIRRKRTAIEYGNLLALISAERLQIRPGRIEPRVRKRRPKNYTLMGKPRNELKKELLKENH